MSAYWQKVWTLIWPVERRLIGCVIVKNDCYQTLFFMDRMIKVSTCAFNEAVMTPISPDHLTSTPQLFWKCARFLQAVVSICVIAPNKSSSIISLSGAAWWFVTKYHFCPTIHRPCLLSLWPTVTFFSLLLIYDWLFPSASVFIFKAYCFLVSFLMLCSWSICIFSFYNLPIF